MSTQESIVTPIVQAFVKALWASYDKAPQLGRRCKHCQAPMVRTETPAHEPCYECPACHWVAMLDVAPLTFADPPLSDCEHNQVSALMELSNCNAALALEAVRDSGCCGGR